jgi:hypothetical protein
MLGIIPEISTMCMDLSDAFESINTCKGTVLYSLNCNEAPWMNDSRDEGVEVEIAKCQACEEEESSPRQGDTADVDDRSVSSSVNQSTGSSAEYRRRGHIKMDSFTTFLPFDENDIFRSRRLSQGSDSQCFRMCRLHRCTAFSQDSAGDSGVHPLKRDLVSNQRMEPRIVHWDEVVDEEVHVETLE